MVVEAYGPDSDECEPIGYPSGVGVPEYLDDLLDVQIEQAAPAPLFSLYPWVTHDDVGYGSWRNSGLQTWTHGHARMGYLDFPSEGDPTMHSPWIRIQNITRAQNAAYPSDAFLVLTEGQHHSMGSPTTYYSDIYTIDEPDHVAPTDTATLAADHANHGLTHVACDYTPIDAYNGESAALFTPNIAALIHERTDDVWWQSGNAMGFHIDGDLAARPPGADGYEEYERVGLAICDWDGWPRPLGLMHMVYISGTGAIPIPWPTGIQAGETVICVFSASRGRTVTWPSGWTELKELKHDTATIHVGWHKGVGTESGTFNVTLSNVTMLNGFIFRVTNAADPDVTPPECSVGASGTGANPAPDALSPSGGSNKYLAIAAAVSESDNIYTGYPSGWSLFTCYNNMFLEGSMGMAVTVAEASTFAPGVFTIDGTVTEEWVAVTICVYGATAGSPADPVGDNELLAYDSASSLWVNQTAHEAGLQELVPGATEDNLVSFDADGQVQDSGIDPTTFAPGTHDHDADYISVVPSPAVDHFPYQTAGGELADSTYAADDFATDTHDHNADYPIQSAALYAIINAVEDRAYDANSTTLAELADILGSLIADLKAVGMLPVVVTPAAAEMGLTAPQVTVEAEATTTPGAGELTLTAPQATPEADATASPDAEEITLTAPQVTPTIT